MKLVKNILLPVCLALVVLSAPVFANRNEAIAVNADYAERNEITGLTEYRGNVIIRQGTTLINADRVIITTKMIKSVAYHALALRRVTSRARQLMPL
jgi:lipopolysaccharide transport protein LptA